MAPTGEPTSTEIKSPIPVHTTEKTADDIVTDRKLLNTHIEASAGNTTSADIRSEPTRFIANTTIKAIFTAVHNFYFLVFITVETAKFSSIVTAYLLL